MIDFDENGVGNCPKCNGWVSYYERFCSKCGIRLPLPPTIDCLDCQEIGDMSIGHQKRDDESEQYFCTQTGKKL